MRRVAFCFWKREPLAQRRSYLLLLIRRSVLLIILCYISWLYEYKKKTKHKDPSLFLCFDVDAYSFFQLMYSGRAFLMDENLLEKEILSIVILIYWALSGLMTTFWWVKSQKRTPIAFRRIFGKWCHFSRHDGDFSICVIWWGNMRHINKIHVFPKQVIFCSMSMQEAICVIYSKSTS